MAGNRAATRKTILITGASSGLGAGMARAFAARGHDLALCARRLAPLEALADGLSGAGLRVAVRALDVTAGDRVDAVFAELDAELGGLDRVIVNAGVGGGEKVGVGRAEANRALMQTNIVGALNQCEAALQLFRRRNAGHLVLISSMSAVRGLPGRLTTYAASKAALAHLGEGLAVDLVGTPIRVSTILPGYIRTPLNDHVARLPFAVDLDKGVGALVKAIEREPLVAHVPAWPWAPIAALLRHAPLAALRRMGR